MAHALAEVEKKLSGAAIESDVFRYPVQKGAR
jgi:hypothetical protein